MRYAICDMRCGMWDAMSPLILIASVLCCKGAPTCVSCVRPPLENGYSNLIDYWERKRVLEEVFVKLSNQNDFHLLLPKAEK